METQYGRVDQISTDRLLAELERRRREEPGSWTARQALRVMELAGKLNLKMVGELNMCLHSKEAVKEALSHSAHAMGTPYSVVWVESKDGKEVRGVDCIRAIDWDKINKTIHSLQQEWHSSMGPDYWVVHLEHVNLKRWYQGLPPFSAELPTLAAAS